MRFWVIFFEKVFNYWFVCFLARGRPKKTTEESSDSQASETSITENEEAKMNDESKNENAETNSHDEKEETANNNAEASKVSTKNELIYCV